MIWWQNQKTCPFSESIRGQPNAILHVRKHRYRRARARTHTHTHIPSSFCTDTYPTHLNIGQSKLNHGPSSLPNERIKWTHLLTSSDPLLGYDDDNVELIVLGCRVDILGTNYDQCVSMVQCCFTSTETIGRVRTKIPGRPPRLSHSLLGYQWIGV